MAKRINPLRTSPTEAARSLWKRYGKYAHTIASNRYDSAETEATAAFYERVIQELYRVAVHGEVTR